MFVSIEEIENSLRPCPFCGHRAHVDETHIANNGVTIRIKCGACGAAVTHTRIFDDLLCVDPWGRLTAVQFWNGEALRLEIVKEDEV